MALVGGDEVLSLLHIVVRVEEVSQTPGGDMAIVMAEECLHRWHCDFQALAVGVEESLWRRESRVSAIVVDRSAPPRCRSLHAMPWMDVFKVVLGFTYQASPSTGCHDEFLALLAPVTDEIQTRTP
jgi:hypothetical protein